MEICFLYLFFSLSLNLTLHDYGKKIFCYFDKEDFGEGFLKVSDNMAWYILHM